VLTCYSSFFDSYALIWNNYGTHWTRRDQCILYGPEFLSFKSVLSRTYQGDTLVDGFFINILKIPGLVLEDVLHEVDFRRDSRPGSTSIAIMRDLYAFLALTATSEDDWRTIK